MCPFDEKANLHHAYSVDDCNGLLKERGIGPQAIIYAILVYASADCPETNVGNDKAMSMRNVYHGYMYWWLFQQFLLHAVQNHYFTVPGLSTEDGTAVLPSSFDRMSALTTRKRHEMHEAIELIGGKVPDLYNYFFLVPEASAPADDIHSEDEDESGAENNGIMTGDDDPSSPN